MKKYLIFRTDRIGDFITSQIISNSIKQKSNKNQIDFVVSKYNYEYIKNFKYISNIYIFNKTGLKFLDIILLYIKVRDKYDFLIVLDGKRRSFISGIFISSFKKVCFMKGFYSKILTSLFYDKYIKNDKRKYQYKNFETLLN
jgi:ADP-heptose:LPS heptosyltransferase